MNDYLEDLTDWFDLDFSRNNPKFEGMFDRLIEHSGYILARLLRGHFNELATDKYAASNEIGHWLNEISTFTIDLANNKYIQEYLDKNNTDVIKNSISRYTENVEKRVREIQKKDQGYIKPITLEGFYPEFIDWFIHELSSIYNELKINPIHNWSKFDRNVLQDKLNFEYSRFYANYLEDSLDFDSYIRL